MRVIFFLMMNDMMPTIEETISADIEAQMEHEEWTREQETQDRWANLVAVHGPLMTDVEWQKYLTEYGEYLDMVWKD